MGRSRTNSGLAEDLLIELDRDAGVPLHRQIEASIRASIRAGRLRAGASLPPTRTLAAGLGVSRGVVVEAYQQLVAEGYLASRSGGYTQVAATMPQTVAGAGSAASTATSMAASTAGSTAQQAARSVGFRIDFGYGRTDVSQFPRAAWLRSVRTVLTTTPNDRFAYLDGRGVPELRQALCDYLNRVRGTLAVPGNVVVCNGYGQGVALLIQVLARRGARRIALEDPSSRDDARVLAAAAGLDVVGIPVGPDGVRVDALDLADADALVLTPSHQWPTGGVLSATARAEVIRWARRRGAIVIEDDYDAEYRYDRSPVGAMQGLAPEHVVYCGTASKTLAPGLRLGWMVVPPQLVADVAAAKLLADRGSSVIDQLTFADFLTRGEFDRHLRRMRPVYRRRRDALLDALRTHLPDLRPAGIAAGQHVVAWLPPDLDEAAVVAAAARHGLGIQGVGPFRIAGAGPGGLIFGYAILSESAIAEGVALLATAIREVRGS
ncbi:GntR family transcriptional regulator / MocR family aminotransferase [Microbispora rosea]|uniref:GntR family transcriptional regulator / MocR family aminotransferase n=1 Tax=Microbispora rosea TaxID=58117 RepID=A0A1N6XLC3_9ACTN|nr:PLP-dependent aminotransferase family protein [Microbispora rosea]GIH51009.1 GntR family transcriptional regulator [Microbispora rosea subsp. rosea]SIR03168.1 GntR family transcriptional regulator / MocR family aminotransferase [Microbispora rosea]